MIRGKRDSAYALVPLDRSRMTIAGNTDDMLKVADLRKTIKGEFIWFAERDKSYVIEDPALVAQLFAEALAEPAIRGRFRRIDFAVFDPKPPHAVLRAFEQALGTRELAT